MEREEDDVELAWKAALDDEAFAKLSDADLGYAHAPMAPAVPLEPAPPRDEAPRAPAAPPRVKRKNFSKQLQLLSLQRYAQYARDFGRLPDKQETQSLLQQSYVQFLKEGGAPEEPRLTPQEFLKLIRNRRREINVRAQKPAKKAEQAAALTPARRKWQEEQNKIRELIEVIDRTREQAGLIPDQQQRRKTAASAQTQVDVMPSMMEGLPPLPLDPMEQMEAILQIHQETRDVQREIAVRLRAIGRAITQHEGHGEMEEPSSASV